MSLMCLGVPTCLVLGFSTAGLAPKRRITKSIFEVGMIGVGTYVGLPTCLAVFPSLSQKKGTDLEN